MNNVIQLDKKAIQERLDRFAAVEERYNKFDFSAMPLELAEAECRKISDERLEGLHTGYGPLAGMPCTYCIGSDSYAALVTWVSASGHQIKVKTGHDMEGRLFTRRKDGEYRAAGHHGGTITFLKAETNLDPSF